MRLLLMAFGDAQAWHTEPHVAEGCVKAIIGIPFRMYFAVTVKHVRPLCAGDGHYFACAPIKLFVDNAVMQTAR